MPPLQDGNEPVLPHFKYTCMHPFVRLLWFLKAYNIFMLVSEIIKVTIAADQGGTLKHYTWCDTFIYVKYLVSS